MKAPSAPTPLTPGQTTMGAAAPCPVVNSADLLRGRKDTLIAHGGCIYRLQVTRGDKLILTK